MENARELITSSYEEQKKWMEENYPDHLLDAHNENDIGTLFTDLNRHIAEARSKKGFVRSQKYFLMLPI